MVPRRCSDVVRHSGKLVIARLGGTALLSLDTSKVRGGLGFRALAKVCNLGVRGFVRSVCSGDFLWITHLAKVLEFRAPGTLVFSQSSKRPARTNTVMQTHESLKIRWISL